jgi:hypothetical protein
MSAVPVDGLPDPLARPPLNNPERDVVLRREFAKEAVVIRERFIECASRPPTAEPLQDLDLRRVRFAEAETFVRWTMSRRRAIRDGCHFPGYAHGRALRALRRT